MNRFIQKYPTTILLVLLLAVIAVVLGPPIVHHVQQLNASLDSATSLSIMSVGGVLAIGATRVLPGTYLHGGQSYGPGETEVPDDFPELREDGSVIFPKGSKAAINQDLSRKANGRPAPVARDASRALSHTVSGKTEAELKVMKKDELEALATELGIEVSRADGDTEKEPTVDDYRAALGAKV